MPTETRDSDIAFKSRTVSRSLTTSWDTLSFSPRASVVEFRARGGNVRIRVNASGNNFLDVGPGDYPFKVSLEGSPVVEARGQNGGETLVCYIS